MPFASTGHFVAIRCAGLTAIDVPGVDQLQVPLSRYNHAHASLVLCYLFFFSYSSWRIQIAIRRTEARTLRLGCYWCAGGG